MEVKLFIYTDSIVYDEIGITADITTLTADTTSITADATTSLLPFTSRIARQIDLFSDEKISITSSIQNINDISKVFTDYSQSFTIPASKKNNAIFKHWYENAIDNGFNQLIRYDGFIEIDTKVFRVGKFQLESASIKQNKIENYKITFYGNLKSLIDRFGEDKLMNIETLNDYTIEYSGANVKSLIETTSDENVMFPLISSSRVWQFGGGGANDISSNTTPILYNELAPALKISKIFEAIQSKYGVSFSGNFLSQSRFKDAYLWFKNKETFSQMSEPSIVNFIGTPYIINNGGFVDFDPTTDTYVSYLTSNLLYPEAKINATLSTSCNWIVSYYKNDVLDFTQTGTGATIDLNIPTELWNGVDAIPYQIKIQTSLPITYSGYVFSSYSDYDSIYNTLQQNSTSYSIGGATGSNLDLTKYAPDIKVSDFFSGILKMFNLTAFSEDEINFTLEQLENWYYQGAIKDFSAYTTTDIEFERIKAYKKIIFEFEKSESFMNRAFYDNAGREYGNLQYQFNIDGSDYNIKLPFETLLFNKFTSTSLQVGYSIDKKFAPYITKPVIFYKLGNANIGADFYFSDGSTTSAISNYNVFGQDVLYNGQNHSLNFGEEISSYYLTSITNSLFNDYYYNYLANLYSLKSRMVKVSMRLPYNELLNLKLNDRIVIRDKRYIINQFTSDLTTFEVKMELIQDFRSITFNNTFGRIADFSAQTLRFDYVSEMPLTWTILSDPDGQIISINNFDTYVDVEIKQNFSGVDKIFSITNDNNDNIIITQNG